MEQIHHKFRSNFNLPLDWNKKHCKLLHLWKFASLHSILFNSIEFFHNLPMNWRPKHHVQKDSIQRSLQLKANVLTICYGAKYDSKLLYMQPSLFIIALWNSLNYLNSLTVSVKEENFKWFFIKNDHFKTILAYIWVHANFSFREKLE